MHVLRLIADDGSVIREYESEHAWTVEYLSGPGDQGAMLCRSGRIRIYPGSYVTVEIEAAEVVPA